MTLPSTRFRAAFSLVELLIASAIGAAIITVGVLAFQNLTANDAYRSSYGRVTVGPALTNFYGGTATAVDAYFAPNYGRAAQAELLRDRLLADVQKASAVYCLGRNSPNTIHPTSIAVSSTFRGDSLDTPEAFRIFLQSAVPASSAIFTSYRGSCTATNASIYILVPSQDAGSLTIFSVYDIDLTPATSPSGTYASVKRYEAGILTDYYDVFYPSSTGAYPFNPLVVSFERSARQAAVEGTSIDSFKKAAARPFYFVWWPDPAAHTLEGYSAGSGAGDMPRSAYSAMEGRTAFFFVIPMFPAL